VPADIKTFATLGCHGMAVLTVATAQSSLGWFAAEALPAEFVAKQLDAVLQDYSADALKTGFLGRVEIIKVVAEKIKEYNIQKSVIDPVLINARALPMFPKELNAAYEEYLFPLASVVTPNLRELNYLVSGELEPWLHTEVSEEVLREYHAKFFAESALIALKGIKKSNDASLLLDGYYDGISFAFEEKPLLKTTNVSGSGDTFAAALSVYLAQGHNEKQALRLASRFTYEAIKHASMWRLASNAGPTANFQTKL
jgi:hydroxymethylpyrimidine kinase/phosphomethylpyrimidine kinase